MGLKLILGPMKSGKSFELISYFAPLKYSQISHMLYHHAKNVRDESVWTRNGFSMKAKKTDNLKEALEKNYQVVGIDEIHMFDLSVVPSIHKLLYRGTEIIVSGLDTDYRGKMFEVIKRLLELGPDSVIYKKAICEKCKNTGATHTQILKDETPILEGLPPVVPDDGTYTYKTVCRKCFITK